MKHPVRHKRQETDYSCGPTCLEMLLDFYGIPYDPQMIEDLCEAKPVHGTDNRRLVRSAEHLGARVVERENAEISDIVKIIESGHPVLVNYFNCKSGVGHFGVVKGVENDRLLLADPKNGDDYELTFDHFAKHWHSHSRTTHAWMMYIER